MDRVSREDFLATVQADRDRFDRIREAVPPALLTEPILPGGWSVKDVLAHIAWGEREGAGVARARALVGSDLWDVSQDERNEAVVRNSRSQGLDAVLDEYRAAFHDYVSAISELSEDELNEPDHVDGLSERIPGWRPWRVIYDPGHYDDHGQAIASAIERQRPDASGMQSTADSTSPATSSRLGREDPQRRTRVSPAKEASVSDAPTDMILAVVSEEGSDDVRRRAIDLARERGAGLILYDADAGARLLEDPLPNQWSGHGEEELFSERLSANDLETAGRAPLARQVREAEAAGIRAWGWLPSDQKAETLRDYATRHGASVVVVDDDLKAGEGLREGGASVEVVRARS